MKAIRPWRRLSKKRSRTKNRNVLYYGQKNDQVSLCKDQAELYYVCSRQEAKSKIEQTNIHCIICPLSETENDGLNLLKEVRKNSHSVPFVFIADRNDKVYKIKALEYGVSRFVDPENCDELPSHLESIFNPDNEESEFKRVLNKISFGDKFFRSR